jgi:hypothetical protein
MSRGIVEEGEVVEVPGRGTGFHSLIASKTEPAGRFNSTTMLECVRTYNVVRVCCA